MPTPKAGYFLKDGTRVPGTTTIIGRFKDSAGLLYWAHGRGKKYPNEPLYEARDAAGDVGTQIHAMIENSIRNIEPAKFPEAMPEPQRKQAQDGFLAFVRWSRRLNLEIAPAETPLVCECHRFGGTPDAIAAEEDGTLSLLDWKSGKSFYWDQLVQLAAYVHLWNVNNEAKIDGNVLIVRFGKDGADFEHREFPLMHMKLAKAWRMFELYREAYELDKFIQGKELA